MQKSAYWWSAKVSRPYSSDKAKRQFDVMGGFWKWVLWRYAATICILFPDIESKLITSQNNHAQSIIPFTTFFNCFTNFTALSIAFRIVTLDYMSNNVSKERLYAVVLYKSTSDVTCTLTYNVKDTTFLEPHASTGFYQLQRL